MERICKFAVLRYVPNEIRKEFINIGTVFHSYQEGFIDFKLTSNFSRIKAFDDEIDLGFLKLLLQGIESEFTNDLVYGPSLNELRDPNFLKKATSIYVNQLQFSTIKVIRSDNCVQESEDIFKMYVYFDQHKKERITEDKVKSILNRVFREHHVLNRLERDVSINVGTENISIDYAYEANNNPKLIKTLSFDYSSHGSKRAPTLAKEWAWNYMQLNKINWIEKFEISGKDLNFITFVYVGNTNKNIDTALKILEGESKLITVSDSSSIVEFANQLSKEFLE